MVVDVIIWDFSTVHIFVGMNSIPPWDTGRDGILPIWCMIIDSVSLLESLIIAEMEERKPLLWSRIPLLNFLYIIIQKLTITARKVFSQWLCIFFKANSDDWINMVWVLCIYLEHDLRARAYDIDFYFQCIETYSSRTLKMKTSHCRAGVCTATFFNVCSSSPTYSLWSKSFSVASLYGS